MLLISAEILTILVFNKIDAYSFILKDEDDLTEFKKENRSLEYLKHTWMNNLEVESIFISAIDKTNFHSLKDMLYDRIKDLHVKRYPYNNFLY